MPGFVKIAEVHYHAKAKRRITMRFRHTNRIARGPSGCAVVLVCLLAVAAFQTPVQAYIDPGASGMVVQMIIGTVAALGYGVRRIIKQACLSLWAMCGGKKSSE